jgi:TetR/AcrR family transcriptional regulator
MDNRARLLDTALHLFVSRGYDAVGVQEIVDATGVSKPTLYHYFGKKLGVMTAIADARGARIFDAVRAAADYQGDLPLTLNRIVRTYFRLATEDPAYQRLRLSLWLAPPGSEAGMVIADQLDREDALLVALFEAAAHDHGNMRGRARQYATALQGAVFSHIAAYLRTDAPLDDELAFRVVHRYMHGIYS